MPTPKSKRTIVLQSSNHDSLRDAVTDSQNESTESDGADTLLAGYSADNGSSDERKLKQLRPLGQQLFSSQEESGETIPVVSDITLTNKPPVLKKTITVTNNNDSGPGSLRNAIATAAQEESTEYFNGSNGVLTVAGEGPDILTGEDYSEARHNFTISTGNGNDLFRSTSISTIDTGNGDDFRSTSRSINTGDGNDTFRSTLRIINTGNNADSIIGGYSELRPISEIITLPPPKPSFQFNGFPGLSLTISGNNSSRVFF